MSSPAESEIPEDVPLCEPRPNSKKATKHATKKRLPAKIDKNKVKKSQKVTKNKSKTKALTKSVAKPRVTRTRTATCTLSESDSNPVNYESDVTSEMALHSDLFESEEDASEVPTIADLIKNGDRRQAVRKAADRAAAASSSRKQVGDHRQCIVCLNDQLAGTRPVQSAVCLVLIVERTRVAGIYGTGACN